MQKVEESSDLTAEEKYNLNHELSVKAGPIQQRPRRGPGRDPHRRRSPRRNPDRGRSGFATEPQDTFTTAVPGQSFGVTAYLDQSQQALPIEIRSLALRSARNGDWHITTVTPLHGALQGNQRKTAEFHVTVPEDATFTRACFHRKDLSSSPYYDLDSVRLFGSPAPALSIGSLGSNSASTE